MTGKLFINGKDAWDTWRVSMCAGFLEALLVPAPLCIENESTPQLNKEILPTWGERNVNLLIRIEGETQKEYLQHYAEFTSEFQKELLLLHVPVLESTYKLTYIGASRLILNIGKTFSEVTFRFNEPNPSDRG